MNNLNDPLQLLRKEYAERMLRRDELNTNPLMQFDAWMNEAVRVQCGLPFNLWFGWTTPRTHGPVEGRR